METRVKIEGDYQSRERMIGDHFIRDVWAHNLREEMELIQQIIDDCQYIAMDTEFPGTVARPVDKDDIDYQYKTLKCNVDLLKIIQLGLSFCDATGQRSPQTWQFNFKFSLVSDMYAQDSIDFLKSCGMDFDKLERDGIDVKDFAEIIMMSGVVLNDDITWITFHSGYDYGYLLKTLTAQPLPDDENDFFELLDTYFPRVYDIKYLMKTCNSLNGGLSKVARDLQVVRVGPEHQAGSDSLFTAATFFRLREVFPSEIDEEKCGLLFGLGHNLKKRRNRALKLL